MRSIFPYHKLRGPAYQDNPRDWDATDAILSALIIVDEEGGDFLHILRTRFGYDVIKKEKKDV